MIFDTHAHYDDEQFDTDRDELLSSMAAGGVGTIVDAAATVESWDKIVELAEKYSFIYGSIENVKSACFDNDIPFFENRFEIC